MEKTIAIIGGSQESTYQRVAKKKGCHVLFHNGKTSGKGSKKFFRKMVRQADCVIVLVGACGHISMDIVKDLCKKTNTPICFHSNFGATGAIEKALKKAA